MKIGELSGSLTNLLDGTSYLIAGANVTIVSESNGAVIISSTGGGGPVGDQFFFSTTSGSIYSSGSLALVGGGDEWGVIDSPADKGTDVFFYVSGSIGSKDSADSGVSLFGGDVVISGSFFSEGDIIEMTGSLTVTSGISGSLTRLSDGTSYLIAGKNIGIISQSNGSIIISSSTPTLIYRPGGVDTDNVYSSWSSLMSAFDQLEGVVTIDVDTSVTSPAAVPVGTYDLESRAVIRGTQTGAVYPSQLQLADGVVIKNPREFENIWLDLQATSTPNFVFDVDDRTVKIAGVSYVEMNGTQPFADITAALSLGIFFAIKNDVIINNYATSNRNFLSINNAAAAVIINVTDNIVLNNDNFIAGTAGSLYVYHDSSLSVEFANRLPTNPNFSGTTVITPLDNAKLVSYDDLFAGTTELSAPTVQVAIDVLKNRWSSSVSDHLFTTSSIAIKGNELGIDQALDKGTDVFFYVSGSQGSKGGVTPGVALFGGDVVISGTLHGGSPLKVSGSMQVSGSFSQGYNSKAISQDSFASGESVIAGCKGYIGNISTPGLVVLDSSYGDVTSEFQPTSCAILVDDKDYDNNYYYKVFKVVDYSVTFNSPSTEITLQDSSATTTTAIIGIEGNSLPSLADYIIGFNASAEGNGTYAQGPYSHAEGGSSVSSGVGSHAEGSSIAAGEVSHSEGLVTRAHGDFSHAEGWATKAIGNASHAEGYNTIADAARSHAEGDSTNAIGAASHAEGYNTIASGSYSHAEGSFTRALSFGSHVEGTGNYAGFYGYSAGVASGVITLDSSYGDVTSQFPAGTYLILDDTPHDNIYQYLVLKIDSVAFTTSTVITLVDTGITTTTAIIGVEGSGNPTSADKVLSYSVLGGSHAEGVGTIAHGPKTHAEGEDSTASGMVSHAEGYGTIAGGNFSHSEGVNTVARGAASHAEGEGTIAIGDRSHTSGIYTIASGSAQTVIGKYNLRDNDFSLFVVGNGTGDANNLRSDVFRISQSTVEVTGSLQVTGSLYVTGSSFVGMISEGYDHSVGGTGTVVYNITANSIFYVNNPVGDITANFTNVPTTDYRIITTTVILSQSSTPRIVNAVQIDGVGSAIDWLNGSTPSGTADKQDVFSFNLIRSGSAWKTLGQLSTYG